MPEVAGRHCPKLSCDLDVDPGGLLEAAALYQAHGSIDNGFRCQPMARSRFKPEDVAWQVECADLTPPIGKQLVAADRA